MDWNTDFPPALTPEEYRTWMISAFHDVTWQHALTALGLSTEDYAKQVVQVSGKTQLTHNLANVMAYIRNFERQIADGKEVEVAGQNLALFCDAEKRLRSVARYCLDNNINLTVTPAHPTEALQTVSRDPETLELISSRTVYKFD